MTLDTFIEKYNKSTDPIPVEEKHVMDESGVYEAELWHDNVDDDTVMVYSGASLSGSKIAFSLTAPSLTPWKRVIHVETDQPTIYISYETKGDQVECDDINKLQTALAKTQEFANELSDEIKGGVAYTWNRLMGKEAKESLKITQQPADETVTAGEDAYFTIAASSDEGEVSYQWQVEPAGSSIWTNLADSTGTTLTLSAVTTELNGNRYRCRVSDTAGNTLVSEAATLHVSS